MKQEIKKILQEYNLKITEESEEDITFKIKKISVTIQIEEDEYAQIWISHVEGADLSSEYYDHTLLYGDIDEIESFIMAVVDGEYNYIGDLYKNLEKLQEKYEDKFDDMARYFI